MNARGLITMRAQPNGHQTEWLMMVPAGVRLMAAAASACTGIVGTILDLLPRLPPAAAGVIVASAALPPPANPGMAVGLIRMSSLFLMALPRRSRPRPQRRLEVRRGIALARLIASDRIAAAEICLVHRAAFGAFASRAQRHASLRRGLCVVALARAGGAIGGMSVDSCIGADKVQKG